MNEKFRVFYSGMIDLLIEFNFEWMLIDISKYLSKFHLNLNFLNKYFLLI